MKFRIYTSLLREKPESPPQWMAQIFIGYTLDVFKDFLSYYSTTEKMFVTNYKLDYWQTLIFV
jgi:hypothetical protein